MKHKCNRDSLRRAICKHAKDSETMKHMLVGLVKPDPFTCIRKMEFYGCAMPPVLLHSQHASRDCAGVRGTISFP